MTVEDIVAFKIRYNIDKECRREYYTHNRMYLYAILFHIHKWPLERIGLQFNKDHSTVLSALKKVEHVQHRDDFIENTKLLQSQYFFIIPEYKNNKGAKRKKKKRQIDDVFLAKINLDKKSYIKYLQAKKPEELYDIIWQLTVDKLSTRIKSIKNKL